MGHLYMGHQSTHPLISCLPVAPTVAHRAGRSARPHRGQCAIAHILARDSQSQPLSDDDLERLKARLNAQLAAGGGPSAAAKAEQAAALATVATVPSSHQPDNCFQWNQSLGWNPQPHHLSKADLWQAIRQEAKADADAEPALASFLYSTVLVHANLEKTLAFVLANKLASATLLGTQLMALFNQVRCTTAENHKNVKTPTAGSCCANGRGARPFVLVKWPGTLK